MDVDISVPFYMAVAVHSAWMIFPVIVAPPVWSGLRIIIWDFPVRLIWFGDVSEFAGGYFSQHLCQWVQADYFRQWTRGNAAPCRAVSWQVAEENIFTLSFNWWDIGG